MPAEPAIKRVVAFIDGQNLFYAAKTAFGYKHPNYDPKALATRLCEPPDLLRSLCSRRLILLPPLPSSLCFAATSRG
ncbi:MAG TPA: hypothetical protein VN836_06240 [Verrucomicrobiae bacterium]|nr:hypothetical protein [Verrucomicrobiae bacterium]